MRIWLGPFPKLLGLRFVSSAGGGAATRLDFSTGRVEGARDPRRSLELPSASSGRRTGAPWGKEQPAGASS